MLVPGLLPLMTCPCACVRRCRACVRPGQAASVSRTYPGPTTASHSPAVPDSARCPHRHAALGLIASRVRSTPFVRVVPSPSCCRPIGSRAPTGNPRVIAAADDVDSDYVRTALVKHDLQVSRPAGSAQDGSGEQEVLGRDTCRTPNKNSFAEGLTREPHDDRPHATPVLYASLIHARTKKMGRNQSPCQRGESLGHRR
jgi:hypothetical protein